MTVGNDNVICHFQCPTDRARLIQECEAKQVNLLHDSTNHVILYIIIYIHDYIKLLS